MKKFNDTGVCIPGRHYMADISDKIDRIVRLVEEGEYFAINRPRQFGKTTTLFVLTKRLFADETYLPIRISFEGRGEDTYSSKKRFFEALRFSIDRFFRFNGLEDLSRFMEQSGPLDTFLHWDRYISELCEQAAKPVVLMIDEVDKSSGKQLFLDFLGLLRAKYMARSEGQDITFQSVVLAGVHDVKSLKARIRPDTERKYDSPWNIAADFDIDLCFSPAEIEPMLEDYARERHVALDAPDLARMLHYYTSGYPYLVSKLCKFVDEKIAASREPKDWSPADVDAAFRMIVDGAYSTTLFDTLGKELENHPELYELTFQIAINGITHPFHISDPVTNLGHLFGILAPSEEGNCRIHNRIFEQRIYEHMMSKFLRKKGEETTALDSAAELQTGEGLNVEQVLKRFQAFMKEHASGRDAGFLEREGRLLFLAYLRPFINGKGFDFKEPSVGNERRMDIVVTCEGQRHVIELKIWRGPEYHRKGLKQLSDYLDTCSLDKGYLLIFDFNKNKEYKQKRIVYENKGIFAVWV